MRDLVLAFTCFVTLSLAALWSTIRRQRRLRNQRMMARIAELEADYKAIENKENGQ